PPACDRPSAFPAGIRPPALRAARPRPRRVSAPTATPPPRASRRDARRTPRAAARRRGAPDAGSPAAMPPRRGGARQTRESRAVSRADDSPVPSRIGSRGISMLLMMWLNDDPSHPRTGAQVDAAVRTATKVAIVVALAGAVV